MRFNDGALARRSMSAPLEPVRRKELSMMDFIMLAIAFAFFAISVGYVFACERL
jgi:hypothetical protein